ASAPAALAGPTPQLRMRVPSGAPSMRQGAPGTSAAPRAASTRRVSWGTAPTTSSGVARGKAGLMVTPGYPRVIRSEADPEEDEMSELAASKVKKLLVEGGDGIRVSSGAIPVAIEAGGKVLRRIGARAASIARSNGRKTVMP